MTACRKERKNEILHNMPTGMNKMKRIQNLLLAVTWTAAICSALIFTAVKIRNWGPVLDAPWQGDFIVYRDAARVLDSEPEQLYRTSQWPKVLNEPDVSMNPFQYMPAIGMALIPFARMPVETAQRIWFWLSVAAFLPVVVLVARRIPPGRARVIGVGMMFLLPAFLDALYLGQITFVMALLVVLAWYGMDAQRPWVRILAGVCLGIACGIKPIVVGLALVALLRRRIGFLAGMVAALAALTGVGLLKLPASVTLDYIAVMRDFTEKMTPREMTYLIFWNQSIPAFWQKLFGAQYAALATGISFGCVAAILFAIVRRSLRSARLSKRTDVIEVSAALLGVLLCAPMTWLHYILATAPVFAGIARAWQSQTHFIGRMALPVGICMAMLQRAAEPLVAATGIQMFSSLMAISMSLWLGMLLATAPTHNLSPSSSH